jgi:hypothetical protein
MDQKHLCEACRERKARFQYRGVVKADRAHTLCFACFRSERDRLRARALVTEPSGRHLNPIEAGKSEAGRLEASAVAPPFSTGTATLTPAQRAHRFRMLRHLRRAGSPR